MEEGVANKTVTMQAPAATYRQNVLCWSSILCLFSVVHMTQNRLLAGFDAVDHMFPNNSVESLGHFLLDHAPIIKGALFWLAMAVFVSGMLKELISYVERTSWRGVLSTLRVSCVVTLALLTLSSHFGNASMGTGYAAMSLDPFAQASDWYHKRLLMPAIAHALFLRGNWPYFAFSLMITILFLALLWSWVKCEAPIPLWQFFSLCTSTFVLFQFQFPGYPDSLVFSLLLGVMFPHTSQASRFRLLVLALLAHEASLFIGLPLAIRYLNRHHAVSYATSLGLYGFIWLACSRFQLGTLLASHDVNGTPGVDWITHHPVLASAGIFFAFKALWTLPSLIILRAKSEAMYREVRFVFLCLAGGFLLVGVGIDTSRMFGFAFPAVLVSLNILRKISPKEALDRFLSAVFLVNLLIPPFVVGLNTGFSLAPGLYSFILGLVLSWL